MKIVIETPQDGEEDEIIIRCHELDEEMMELISRLKSGKSPITGYKDSAVRKIVPREIYYFESVDNKVFAYCEKEVYEIEERYNHSDFQRISKSVIVNVSLIEYISPLLGSRLEAKLKNGEKVIISRQYVPELKKKLGIAER